MVCLCMPIISFVIDVYTSLTNLENHISDFNILANWFNIDEIQSINSVLKHNELEAYQIKLL